MPKHRVTIKDIARSLGVSPATVSLALNDGPGVSAQTRQRVQEYARRVRYRPNPAARAIITGHSRLVAVVMGRLTDSFFEEIVQGIENVAAHGGFDLLVNTVHDPMLPETELIERLLVRRIDGMIGASYSLSEPAARYLQEMRVPVLLLRPEPAGAQPFIAVDNRLGGRLAAEHLVGFGHRRVVYIGDASAFSRLRYEGAREVIEAAGGRLEHSTLPQGLDRNGAYDSTRRRLRQGGDFTAVFCADDVLATGSCHALHDAGLKVPAQVSVVGFDDLRWTGLLSPPLTTVHQPQVSQGETAMRMLMDLIAGKPVQSRILPPQLVVRGSTGPAPAL